MQDAPNIVLIMADQMTPFMVGAYGNRQARTPNIDRLAEEGVRFDAAYTPCPLCAPARAAMLTGKYVSRIGKHDNAAEWSSELPTIAHHLRMREYETVLAGKMHMIGPDQLHGFERRLTTDVYPSDFSWTPLRTDAPARNPHGAPIGRAYVNAGVRPWTWQMSYDEEVHFRAIEYLHNRCVHKPTGRPFFLCVSYSHPHEPLHTTQELWDLYEHDRIEIPSLDEGHEPFVVDRWLEVFHGLDEIDIMGRGNLRKLRHAYLANCSYIDRKVGEIVEALRRTSILDNTLVVFTSDHGDMLGERGMVQKRCFYEWSARVPLVFRFPARWPTGRVVAQPVSLVDLFATFNDLAGGPEPVDVDGTSLLALLDDREARDDAEVISEYHGEGMLAPTFMLRRGNHKYVYVHGHGEQLFDLNADPSERTNLARAEESKQVADEMRRRILDIFDPEGIESRVRLSQRRRSFIREAVGHGKSPAWDYQPFFNAARMYIRGRSVT